VRKWIKWQNENFLYYPTVPTAITASRQQQSFFKTQTIETNRQIFKLQLAMKAKIWW
jgi:hypothetical protein